MSREAPGRALDRMPKAVDRGTPLAGHEPSRSTKILPSLTSYFARSSASASESTLIAACGWRALIARMGSDPGRYRAGYKRPSYVTRWRLTGWLGRRDSNLCILDCNSPKTPSQGVRIRISASWNRDLSLGPGPGAPAALSKNVAGVRPTTQPVGPR